MKVLFMANIPSPYRVEFFDLLAEKCDLTVLYERKSASDRENDWYIEQKNKKKYQIYFLKGITYSNDAAVAPGVIRFLKKEKYDVIVVSGYSSITQMLAIMTLKYKRIPYILNVDGGIIRRESKFKSWYKTKLVSGASCYLSTGKACDDFLMHYGASKDKLKRYPFTSIREENIIKAPLSAEEKETYKQKINCLSPKMILSVGQPIHRKGFDVLLKAMTQLNRNDISTYIVGGEVNEECKSLMDKYNLSNIHFIPFMKKEKLADYYKAADFFVFPTREDIWGLVINEAMAYGLPVITTTLCNAGLELVRDGINGYIVPIEDANSLSETITRVLTIDDREKLGRNSLERIKSYTLENMADEHIKIFENVTRLRER